MKTFRILIILLIITGCSPDPENNQEIQTAEVVEEPAVPKVYLRLDPVFKGVFSPYSDFSTPGQTLRGTLLAVDRAGEERSFPWILVLRKDEYRAWSVSRAELPPGYYNIYLLIQYGSRQYIGFTRRTDVSEPVAVNISPYIGRTLTNPIQIKGLLRFEVNWPKNKFTVPVNTAHTWLGIKEEDNEELFYRTELKSLRSFHWFADFYVEKLPFPRKYEIRAYSVPPDSAPVQWGRVRSRIPSFTDKEGKTLVREAEYILIAADHKYNYVGSWLQPLKIKVYYTRDDFRKWAVQRGGPDAIPVYMYLPHTEIKIVYVLPTDIAEMMNSNGNIKLHGSVYHKKEGVLFPHTAGYNTDRRNKSVFFYNSPTVEQSAGIAEYIGLTVMDGGRGKILGVCPRIPVPKHKCKTDYHVPYSQMCDYRSPELNCQIQIKRPSLNNYKYF